MSNLCAHTNYRPLLFYMASDAKWSSDVHAFDMRYPFFAHDPDDTKLSDTWLKFDHIEKKYQQYIRL